MSFVTPTNASRALHLQKQSRETRVVITLVVSVSVSARHGAGLGEKIDGQRSKRLPMPCPSRRYAQILPQRDAFLCFFRSKVNGDHLAPS